MKELDDSTAKLLKSLDREQLRLWKEYRVAVWVFWIDGDAKTAKKWLADQDITKLRFATVKSEQLKAWRIRSDIRNLLVTVSKRAKATATFRDLKVEDIGKLEEELSKLSSSR